MADFVRMPPLGESVSEGTVTRWLKQVGDAVDVDEPLLEISTDKVDTEIPSPIAGTLVEILAAEDEVVAVGMPLASIGSPDEIKQAVEVEQPTDQQHSPEAYTPDVSPAEHGGTAETALPDFAQFAAYVEHTEQSADTAPANDQPEPWTTEPLVTHQAEPVEQAEDDTPEPPDSLGTAEEEPVSQSGAAPGRRAEDVRTNEQSTASGRGPEHADSRTGGYLTPLVRKLAAAAGVDVATVVGTGVGGRIRKEDVLAAATPRDPHLTGDAATPGDRTVALEPEQGTHEPEPKSRSVDQALETSAPEIAETEPAGGDTMSGAVLAPAGAPRSRGTTETASRLRQIIASRMVESLHSMAQLTTVVEVDVTRLARLRARAKDAFASREGIHLTYLPFFVLAATEALKAHPKINAVLEGDQITYFDRQNVGIAVDTERGLMVPVIHDAGNLDLAAIAHSIADLATRTRDGAITPDELSGGTFTVTNTGSTGALIDTPIIPSGTSAILATGAIVKRAIVLTDKDGADSIAIRSMCFLSLSYDHRLVDGADASRYLATVKKRLEDGSFGANPEL